MIDNNQNHEHDEPSDMVQRLSDAAGQIQPDPYFAAELEKKLRMKHKPDTHRKYPAFKALVPALGWMALVAAFTFVLSWSIRNLTPRGQPGAVTTPAIVNGENNAPVTEATEGTENAGYPFRGGKVYLTAPLPAAPAQANVYQLNREEPITADEALAFAAQFGIRGEIYNAQDLLYKYVVTDGRQSMSIGSQRRFFYTSDLIKYARNSSGSQHEDAEAIIHEFLQSRGIDFTFSLSNRELFGGYVLQQTAPDGLPMQYEYFSSPVMRVTLDENGGVLALDANWMDFNQTPVGAYGILSADEAMQKVLDDSLPGGKIESIHSGGGELPQQWYREYEDGQTVSIFGSLAVAPAVNPSVPPLITLDGTRLSGITAGLETLNNYTYLKATGHYNTENDIRTFIVDTWDPNAATEYVSGSLRREGDRIILASDDGTREYTLLDPPADVPLNTPFPESQISVNGVIAGEALDWINITYYSDASQMGGGGGGGGLGFYQLNLSGTPIPFPSPETTPAIPDLPTITRLDGQRGMLNVNMFSNEDGSVRTEYGFVFSDPDVQYLILKGEDLAEMQNYNNKPVEIWGTVDGANEYGTPVVNVERYNLPFPDLKPQILKGREKSVELEGNPAVLFTTDDGTTFVEFMPGCHDVIPVESMSGTKGGGEGQADAGILMEAIAIPDLSFAGYPGLCVFTTAPATQQDGSPFELTITSDQPNNLSDIPALAADRSKLTIDTVELIYFVSNPNVPNAVPGDLYLQPAWHFHGHYETGDEFDVIVQALKQEFLSPDIAPYIQGG